MISFELLHKDGQARRGRVTTPHGVIETPVFMPVGTAGSVKSVTSEAVVESGAQIILCNTYHLYLRPGMDVMKEFKGVHNFMHWNKPILTDSGGFQVFSLAKGLSKVTDEGVVFKSHIDGSTHLFTPEFSMEMQHAIGSDIIMAFDMLVKSSASYDEAKEKTEKTLAWLDRCVTAWHGYDPDKIQSLFGIVQGGNFKDLRRESAYRTLERNLPGIAIGGEDIGYSKERTKETLEWLLDVLPPSIPHYAMGVGDVDDIFEIVERGVDMFDCVAPTRMARNGALLISPREGGCKENKFRLNITKSMYAMDESPIDRSCTCFTCKNYSRGYLRHLFHAEEILAYSLASIHNISLLSTLCVNIRQAIEHDTFQTLKAEWLG